MAASPLESAELHAALVAAYPAYVDGVVAARGWEHPPGWDDAVATGKAWLDSSLGGLFDLPLGEQRRSPLELFQEALQFPTEALRAGGLAPVERDETAQRALPGDLYHLAPASSRDLGEGAWQAHLAWGVAKARLVAGAVPRSAPVPAPPSPVRDRTVALVGTDLMDRSRIEPVVHDAGLTLAIWRNPAAVERGLATSRPVLVLVDLTHPAADEALRGAAAAGVRSYAFGPHVDDVALIRAQSLGATDALTRSRFFRRLPEIVPRLV